MQESPYKIYISNDYSKFHIIGGNRQLIESKIRKIKDDIADGCDLLPFCPILVTETNGRYYIADGQHRFFISKQLKRPVSFMIVSKALDLAGIARMNSNTDKWKKSDFVNCYVYQGNEHYITLQSFMDKYKVSVSLALQLLERGYSVSDGGGRNKEAFETGNFQAKYTEQAEAIVTACGKFSEFRSRFRPAFVMAIAKALKSRLYDIDELCLKSEKGARLSPRSVYNDYYPLFDYQIKKGI